MQVCSNGNQALDAAMRQHLLGSRYVQVVNVTVALQHVWSVALSPSSQMKHRLAVSLPDIWLHQQHSQEHPQRWNDERCAVDFPSTCR